MCRCRRGAVGNRSGAAAQLYDSRTPDLGERTEAHDGGRGWQVS